MTERLHEGYERMTIGRFLEQLSSDAPAPGGGSVAALSGALAASLILMVCSLTIGKDKYAEDEEQVGEIRDEAISLRDELLDLANDDTEAYRSVIAAYRLPRDTDEEKQVRQERIQQALKHANEVPYEIAETCRAVLDLNRPLPQIGNRHAVSDVAVSAHQAEAAAQSALYNVDINCNSIKDEVYVDMYRRKRSELSSKAEDLKDEIVAAVREILDR